MCRVQEPCVGNLLRPRGMPEKLARCSLPRGPDGGGDGQYIDHKRPKHPQSSLTDEADDGVDHGEDRHGAHDLVRAGAFGLYDGGRPRPSRSPPARQPGPLARAVVLDEHAEAQEQGEGQQHHGSNARHVCLAHSPRRALPCVPGRRARCPQIRRRRPEPRSSPLRPTAAASGSFELDHPGRCALEASG